jgi:hypothetical protein
VHRQEGFKLTKHASIIQSVQVKLNIDRCFVVGGQYNRRLAFTDMMQLAWQAVLMTS